MFISLVLGYAFLLWFGMYLLQRDLRNRSMAAAGAGLLVYAFGLGAAVLTPLAGTELAGAVLLAIQTTAACLPFLGSAMLLWKSRDDSHGRPYQTLRKPVGLFIGYTCCLLGLALIPSFSAWSMLLRLAGGVLLALLAGWVAVKEIKAQGESWLPDFFRSLDYTVFFTLLFSGQVALVIFWQAGLQFTTLILLLASLAVSIAVQVCLSSLRALLDRIAFVSFPGLREERSRLRLVEQIQTRIDEEAASEEIQEEDLFRYTRRALSHFGDLQRLATSPLTQMEWISRRIRERGGTDEVLERANELKSALLECIVQLKPRSDEAFGTSDEWKYYNALYFPYVIGVKPYSLRYTEEHLDAASREALAWLRTYVPERTLYNWQNAAAKLVALSLKEKYAMVPKKEEETA